MSQVFWFEEGTKGRCLCPTTSTDMIVIEVRDESGDNNGCGSMRKGSGGNEDLRDG